MGKKRWSHMGVSVSLDQVVCSQVRRRREIPFLGCEKSKIVTVNPGPSQRVRNRKII